MRGRKKEPTYAEKDLAHKKSIEKLTRLLKKKRKWKTKRAIREYMTKHYPVHSLKKKGVKTRVMDYDDYYLCLAAIPTSPKYTQLENEKRPVRKRGESEESYEKRLEDYVERFNSRRILIKQPKYNFELYRIRLDVIEKRNDEELDQMLNVEGPLISAINLPIEHYSLKDLVNPEMRETYTPEQLLEMLKEKEENIVDYTIKDVEKIVKHMISMKKTRKERRKKIAYLEDKVRSIYEKTEDFSENLWKKAYNLYGSPNITHKIIPEKEE